MRRLLAASVAVLLAGCAPTATPAGSSAPAPPPSASPSETTPSPSTDASPDGTPARTPSAAPETTTDPPTATQEVPEALRFTSTTVDGKPFDGASLAGDPVLLWFWAPWCPTCRGQIDQVREVADRYGDRVAVVGVGSLDDADAIRTFAGDAAGPVHLVDEQGEVWKRFGIIEQSSFVLLDARGEKVWSAGSGGSQDLADQVAAVVG